MSCSLCLEEIPKSISCSRGHNYCIECLNEWASKVEVSELKGKSSLERVACPYVGDQRCDSSICYQSMLDFGLNINSFDCFKIKSKDASTFLLEDVIHALSIKCPRSSCGVLIDQSPDACAAVICRNCGQNFCACCHATFLNGNEAHLHVPLAHRWRDVFLPVHLVEDGQRRLRLSRLRAILDEIPAADIVDDIIEQSANELKRHNLPVSWSAFKAESDEAIKTIRRERFEHTLENNIATGTENVNNMEPNNVAGLNTAAERGKKIQELCFTSKFDELFILVQRYKQADLDWDVDWRLRCITSNNNAFHIAAWIPDTYLRIACMRLLLQLGADVVLNEPDADGFPPLLRFVSLNDIQSVKFLLDQPNLNIESTVHGTHRTALFLCAEMRFIHIARELILHKAYLHVIDSEGTNVITAVAMRYFNDHPSDSEVVRNVTFWVQQGADFEAPDGVHLWRPLHYAAGGMFGEGAAAVGVIQALLHHGADITARTRSQQTPLMLAVYHGITAVIPILIAAEADNASISLQTLPLEDPQQQIIITEAVNTAAAPVQRLVLSDSKEGKRREITAVVYKAQQWENTKRKVFVAVRFLFDRATMILMAICNNMSLAILTALLLTLVAIYFA